MKTTTIKDILSVIKNDGRFQGNQKHFSAIVGAIVEVEKTHDKSDLISFAAEVKRILTESK